MEDLLIPIVALLCIFVILPGMVLVFIDRQRRRKNEIADPVAPVGADLLALAERMERRIEALEKLLDAEAPGWRKRNAE